MTAVVDACRTASAEAKDKDKPKAKPKAKPAPASDAAAAKDSDDAIKPVMAELDGVRIDPRELLRAVEDMATVEMFVPYVGARRLADRLPQRPLTLPGARPPVDRPAWHACAGRRIRWTTGCRRGSS